MIKIIPSVITNDDIIHFSQQIDYSSQELLHGTVISVPSVRCPEITKKIKSFGDIVNVELLIYNVGASMPAHVDEYSFTQDNKKWEQTGILFLNAPDEYDGGELVFNELNISIKCPQGTLVLLPAGSNISYTHSVTPVTRGRRVSLVYRFTTCG
jgi:hypothetical protein